MKRTLSHCRRLLTTTTTATTTTKKPTFYTLFRCSIPLGPPPTGPFTIDSRALQREFFALQQKSHPDVVRTTDVPSSTLINLAYTTLRDPLTRAQYLLSLHGIEVSEDGALQMDDQPLLAEVMEAHEAIEAAKGEDQIRLLAEENDGRIKESLDTLERMFAAADLEGARRETVRLRYRVNLQETLKALG